MNMLEEHEHLSNHRLGDKGMNMMYIHMIEVEGMDMVEEHSSNHRAEDDNMDMVEKHQSKERPEVEGMNMKVY